MSMFDESLERVYLELANIYVTEARKDDKLNERAELAWDMVQDMKRMWPDKVAEIEKRYRTPVK